MIIRSIELGPDVWKTAYNIAVEPSLHSLTSIINKMGELMNVTIEKTNPSDDNLYMYPTVFSGGMDISKAEVKLGFKPTNFDDMMKMTVEWYDNEFVTQPNYREEMIADLMARYKSII